MEEGSFVRSAHNWSNGVMGLVGYRRFCALHHSKLHQSIIPYFVFVVFT